jgi:hypothetical protein
VADPPRISSRRQVPVRGGKWVALGSAVAASAIAAAALTTFLARPPAPEPSTARAPAAAPAMQGAVLSQDALTTPPIDPVTAAASPPKARHDDRGQHRRRAGDRR